MNLLAISDPVFIPDEAAITSSLFREGLACFHLRKPKSNVEEYCALLRKIEPEFLERISIHQHHHIAKDFGLKRLHFTENQRESTSDERIKTMAESGFIISTSIHDLTKLKLLSTHFSYTFFGPVFDSISKADYKSTLPKNFILNEELKKVSVIALGGIDLSNIEKVRQMNFDGAAILGAIWENPDKAVEIFKQMIQNQPQKGRHILTQGNTLDEAPTKQ